MKPVNYFPELNYLSETKLCSLIKISAFLVGVLFASFVNSQQLTQSDMKKLVDDNLQLAVKQYQYMHKLLPPGVIPCSYNAVKNELITSGATKKFFTNHYT